MNMTACLCGNEFPAHTSAGRVQCYTCSAARNQHTASTRDLVAAMWDVIPRLSCAEIGRRMVPELSKSAVIGIAHRMGLKIRTPANARWGPGKARLPRRLRAHVAFGGALPAGAVTLPVLASTQFRAVASGVAAPPSIPGGRHVTEPGYAMNCRGLRVTPDSRGEPAPVVAAARKAPRVPPQKAPQPPKPPADPRVKPGEKRRPWPVADDGRTCEWIEGSGRPWIKCGAPVSGPGSAWCPAHRRRVYNRPAPFRDAATESAAA